LVVTNSCIGIRRIRRHASRQTPSCAWVNPDFIDAQALELPLRVWDLVEHDLVEREVGGRSARSNFLPGYWVVTEEANLGPALRLSHDAAGARAYLMRAEAAERRLREVEAELAARSER
jgi:hypothetical protein